MLGALLAGGYYVPVNHMSPTIRLRQITEQLHPDFIVASPRLLT